MVDLSNNSYNLVNQLSKKLKAVKHFGQVIKDAQKCKDKECVNLMKRIQSDDKRHAEMIRTHIEKLSKKGKFK